MSAEGFAQALAALLAEAGLDMPNAGSPVRVTAGNLDITITTGARGIDVSLSGWHHAFALPTEDDDSEDDDPLLALDLVGAALFGALRVVVDVYGQQPRRFTLQLARGDLWHTVSTQGARPWNPFAARTSRVEIGDRPRPPRYAPTPVTTLPWAPWAGACGFFGAPTSTTAAELPVDGELDLHNFHPREVKPLVLAYIDACLARGITQLRIVHGKGIGNLRRTVHALLDRHPHVTGHRLGGHGGGGWGATIVDLSPEPGAKKPSTPA